MAAVVQWHSRRVAACSLLLFYVNRRRRNRKRWTNRKVWTKPFISRNLSLVSCRSSVGNLSVNCWPTVDRQSVEGSCSSQLPVQKLRAEDAAAFKHFLRMDQNCFDELLEMVKPQKQKQDTNMRKSITAGKKLALTLRYLATGEFIAPALLNILYTSIFVMALTSKVMRSYFANQRLL